MTPCNLALIYSTLVKELFFVVVSGKKTCLLTLWTWQPLWKVKELDVSLRKKLIWYPVLILEFPAMILKSLFYVILLGYWSSSTGFGKSMNVTVFALAKEEMSSVKTSVIVLLPLKSIISDQIYEMFSLSRRQTSLWQKQYIWSPLLSVRKGIPCSFKRE